MAEITRPAVYFNMHLVSDSTGETLTGVMRAATAQFENVAALEHSYYLVRSRRQLDRVLREIEAAPGIVMFTIADQELRDALERRCRELGCPALAVLDPIFETLRKYLGLEMTNRTGAQYALDAEYFQRVDALHYALAHDDGQGFDDLEDADVVLIGVSRTSKTPTSIYLAHRGIRAANVPLVPGIALAPEVAALRRPLIVGLTIGMDRLIEIRRARLRSWREAVVQDYVNEDRVSEELRHAQRLFGKHDWPVIDVTRRSIEETSAQILNMLAERRRV